MGHAMRKPVNAIYEQQRHRSAYTSVQSDQRLCCSLPIDSVIPIDDVPISRLNLAS